MSHKKGHVCRFYSTAPLVKRKIYQPPTSACTGLCLKITQKPRGVFWLVKGKIGEAMSLNFKPHYPGAAAMTGRSHGSVRRRLRWMAGRVGGSFKYEFNGRANHGILKRLLYDLCMADLMISISDAWKHPHRIFALLPISVKWKFHPTTRWCHCAACVCAAAADVVLGVPPSCLVENKSANTDLWWWSHIPHPSLWI